MVPRQLIPLLALALGLGTAARAELSLNPQTGEYELEGFKFRRVVFSDGDRRVTYAPPPGWEYSGNDQAFIMHPKQKSEAEALVTRLSLSKPQVFDEETMQRLAHDVVASLPPGSTHGQLVSLQKNPLVIERKETFLVVVNYDFVGRPQTRSVLFLNRSNDQVRFQLTCGANDFKELQKAFLASQFSWQNL